MNFPLWYVRDLMMMCVASPLLYLAVRRLGVVFIAFLSLLFVLGATFFTGCSVVAVLFFSLGMFLAMKRDSIVESFRRYEYYAYALSAITLPLSVVCGSGWLGNVYVLCGVVSIFCLVSHAGSLTGFLASLSPAVFFVFATHAIFVMQRVGNVFAMVFPDNLLGRQAQYVLLPFATFAVCVLLYMAMDKLCPKLLHFVCGNR